MSKPILMIAGSDIDHFYDIEDFVGAGDVSMAKPVGKKIGGCVLNTAVVAASKGDQVRVIDYLKEDDKDTYLLVNGLKERKVDTSFIQYGKDVTNGSCLIMSKGDEKCIYVIEPERPYFKYDESLKGLLNSSGYIYSLLHTLMISFEDMQPIRNAREAGAKMIFDGAGHYHSKEETDLLLELADGLFINKQSYKRLCDAHRSDFKRDLLAKGGMFVCITDGENGADCYTKDDSYHADIIKVKVVDSTGAGDSFAGCFLHCLNNGMSYQKCLKYASVSGAYACTGFGGMYACVDMVILENFARDNAYEI